MRHRSARASAPALRWALRTSPLFCGISRPPRLCRRALRSVRLGWRCAADPGGPRRGRIRGRVAGRTPAPPPTPAAAAQPGAARPTPGQEDAPRRAAATSRRTASRYGELAQLLCAVEQIVRPAVLAGQAGRDRFTVISVEQEHDVRLAVAPGDVAVHRGAVRGGHAARTRCSSSWAPTYSV